MAAPAALLLKGRCVQLLVPGALLQQLLLHFLAPSAAAGVLPCCQLEHCWQLPLQGPALQLLLMLLQARLAGAAAATPATLVSLVPSPAGSAPA
jgi:hypothetical protein